MNSIERVLSYWIICIDFLLFSCSVNVQSIKVLDYTQYYLDLASANSLGEAVWQPEYNLTTHYFGSGEVNAVALHNLADRFSHTENPLFQK